MSHTTRAAGKAGSWYLADPHTLEIELDDNLSKVSIQDAEFPIPGARIIIAPHAGYSYSGPCAAWAYRCLDLSKTKRIFILGPSHTYFLEGCAVTTFSKWATPFGDFTVDRETLEAVKKAGSFRDIPSRNDIREHSMEMHLPYLWKRCQQTFQESTKFPPVVPILIGKNSRKQEKDVGKLLSPYLNDEDNVFVISSDFCHWGDSFTYTPYSANLDISNIVSLDNRDSNRLSPPIHEFIRVLDKSAMDAVETGSHDAFVDNLDLTGNTVCGQHPIGVAMAAMEVLREDSTEELGATPKNKFKIVQYDRSNPELVRPDDMSVSYVSAYAVL